MAAHSGHNERPTAGWVRLTPAEAKAFSAESKQAIKATVDLIVERWMKPETLKHGGRRPGFGDVQDIYTKWRGPSLILVAKRRGGKVADSIVPDFETQSGRLTLVGVDSFDVSYFRHTGRWWTIQSGCSLDTALKYFREPSMLWPW
ncbi:MAG: hypothetical protein ABI847_12690 [Anaerolineales bacterium]